LRGAPSPFGPRKGAWHLFWARDGSGPQWPDPVGVRGVVQAVFLTGGRPRTSYCGASPRRHRIDAWKEPASTVCFRLDGLAHRCTAALCRGEGGKGSGRARQGSHPVGQLLVLCQRGSDKLPYRPPSSHCWQITEATAVLGRIVRLGDQSPRPPGIFRLGATAAPRNHERGNVFWCCGGAKAVNPGGSGAKPPPVPGQAAPRRDA